MCDYYYNLIPTNPFITLTYIYIIRDVPSTNTYRAAIKMEDLRGYFQLFEQCHGI